MVGNKKGMVMIYVLLFILISQVIYLGILRINQVNSQRYIDFQDNFKAEIQEKMTMNLLATIESDNHLVLEEYISEKVLTNLDSIGDIESPEWIQITPLSYVRYDQVKDKEQASFYLFEVFMPVELVDYCVDFTQQACSGYISENNQLKPFSPTQASYYNQNTYNLNQVIETVHQNLIEMGFLMKQSSNYRASYSWTPPQNIGLGVLTNNGNSIILKNSQQTMLQTTILPRDFSRIFKTNSMNNRFYIQFTQRDYVRNLEE